MKKYKETFSHLFECILPPLSEEVLWKAHPTLKIEVNNMGLIREVMDNGGYREFQELYGLKRVHNPGKLRYIYEAFNNVILEEGVRIIPKNLNPYDQRIENILILDHNSTQEEKKARAEAEKHFKNLTLEEMLKREEMIGDRFDVLNYFKNLGIPDPYIKRWKNKSPKYSKHKDKKDI